MKILGMDLYRRKTDEEIIKSIRKSFRRPNWCGYINLAASLLYIGGVVYGGWVVANIRNFSEDPAQYDKGLFFGIIMGAFLSMNAIFAADVFRRSIVFLKGSRIEHLLIRYYDELQTLGRIPQEEPRGPSEAQLWS